jgi:EAL domain-containing protein (putative c-di-GMP-specific phosphodiesterase class I)/GGDEF domain-containing protein
LIYLQGYQEINHTLGFRSSDLLLERVAKRINRLAADFEDCLAFKLQGDQNYYAIRVDSLSFAVFFTLKDNKEKYLKDIQHLLELLNRPIELHDMFLDIQARAGVAFAPEHSTNIFTLLRFAQAAVETKVDASITVALYSSMVSQLAARRLKLISGLRRAIHAGELSLVFQAQLDIRERKIVGIEALCRWQHPEYGNVEPSEFVLLAEKTGLIDDLSAWVITEALESLAWFYQRSLKLRLSINISAKNLSNQDFIKNLQSQIESYNLPMKAITLEITETSLMQDPENAIHILNEIHKKGIAVAIDDFGSGYSSLAYIKQLPISELKIDRSFVSQIDSFHSDRVITKSTIVMAHEMGARVCAEGVENASCLKILAQFDCDIAQGFHIAKPLSKEDFVVWMDESQLIA